VVAVSVDGSGTHEDIGRAPLHQISDDQRGRLWKGTRR
jgi:hypothetical protein